MAARRFEILARERRLDGWIAVDDFELRHERFDGGWTPGLKRTVVRRGEAVVVLPYDPIRDEVVLIEQFRAGAVFDADNAWLVETVAGLIDKSLSAGGTARQELREEAGLEAVDLALLWQGYASPGFTDEFIHAFAARVDTRRAGGAHGLDEEHEDIRTFVLSFEDAIGWWRDGRIRNIPVMATLLALAQVRADLRVRWGAS